MNTLLKVSKTKNEVTHMFASVSFAGGCVEFRLLEWNNQIRVERWCKNTKTGTIGSKNTEMLLDDSVQPEYYKDVLRAMIAIAEQIES
jgi:hypothetical protein